MLDEHMGRRYVLRDYPGAAEACALAERREWSVVGERPADPERGLPFEMVWLIEPGCKFYFTHEETARCGHVHVGGRFAEPVERHTEDLGRQPEVHSGAELLQIVDGASTPEERGAALLKLGVGAPHRFDRDFFDRTRAGLEDPDVRLRDLALWAATYSPWAEYKRIIEKLARSDPDRGVRRRAKVTLDALRRVVPDQ